MPTGPDQDALALLLHAFESARDADADPWQFALSISELEAAGLTRTDVRWLLLKDYAALAKEVTAPGDDMRHFRPLRFTALGRSACLTLTETGAAEIARRLAARRTPSAEPPADDAPPPAPPPQPRPHWDPGRRELRVGDAVVKRFRVPAPNQELVLQAFEEEGWPPSIDDPLPPVAEIESQQRLRATIKSLNRSQSRTLIRFHANGGGQVVYWDRIGEGHPPSGRRRRSRKG
ncbi:MAG TPA: hypothetical protein VF170_17195 [Planctomycetaceae bacterium]